MLDLPVAQCEDMQATKGASRFRALVLIGTAATLCAAFTPHMTEPGVASERAETGRSDVWPPLCSLPRHSPLLSRHH